MTRRELIAAFASTGLAQDIAEPPEKPIEFLCPMDKDVTAKVPGKCPRCGMTLVAGLPDFVEFDLDLKASPKPVRSGKPAKLAFFIKDPKTGKPVRDFEIVHEKLFHLFIVSGDLEVFAHEHPMKGFGPQFEFEWTFPKSGMYRLMADYYPMKATPQITVKTLYVADGTNTAIPPLESNTTVTLETEPTGPIAGMRTRLYFALSPAKDLVPWLGAWGHVLVASADTVDLIHTHPFIATGTERMQFNVIFPRPGKHRVWVQFERAGVVNSHRFDVQVSAL